MFLRNGSFRPLTDKIGKTNVGEKYSTIHLYFFAFTSEQRFHCNYDQSLSLLLLFQFLIQKITRLQNMHEIFAQYAEEEKKRKNHSASNEGIQNMKGIKKIEGREKHYTSQTGINRIRIISRPGFISNIAVEQKSSKLKKSKIMEPILDVNKNEVKLEENSGKC